MFSHLAGVRWLNGNSKLTPENCEGGKRACDAICQIEGWKDFDSLSLHIHYAGKTPDNRNPLKLPTELSVSNFIPGRCSFDFVMTLKML